MRNISNIIVHCSDSLWGCARAIREWHQNRGWSDIGYHFVILNGHPTFKNIQSAIAVPFLDGAIECGRYLDNDLILSKTEIGAHAFGYNANSIGVCLIGKDYFTPEQIVSLKRLLRDLTTLYQIPIKNILGHYETASGKRQGKTCPNIDMTPIRKDLSLWLSK